MRQRRYGPLPPRPLSIPLAILLSVPIILAPRAARFNSRTAPRHDDHRAPSFSCRHVVSAGRMPRRAAAHRGSLPLTSASPVPTWYHLLAATTRRSRLDRACEPPAPTS